DRDEVEVDAVGFHLAGVERHHAVVEAAGEGHGKLGHNVVPVDVAATLANGSYFGMTLRFHSSQGRSATDCMIFAVVSHSPSSMYTTSLGPSVIACSCWRALISV